LNGSYRLVVWYNTRWPVCDAGIDWQRNKLVAAIRASHLSFRDINEEPDAPSAPRSTMSAVARARSTKPAA
jgi:predicted DCC family thiol-disulfide oxidoreductase YuxK